MIHATVTISIIMNLVSENIDPLVARDVCNSTLRMWLFEHPDTYELIEGVGQHEIEAHNQALTFANCSSHDLVRIYGPIYPWEVLCTVEAKRVYSRILCGTCGCIEEYTNRHRMPAHTVNGGQCPGSGRQLTAHVVPRSATRVLSRLSPPVPS